MTDLALVDGVGDSPLVTVLGVASIRTEPDEAFVRITLTRTDAAAGAALADVADRTESLRALLDELAVPRKDRSTSGISVQEEFDHTPEGRRSLGYLATATVSICLTDTELIGGIIRRCTEELDARINGPDWQISPTNPVRLEAASRAATNARNKAAAYAAGLDLRLGDLRGLAEPGDDRTGGRGIARAAAFSHDMSVDRGEHEVTATVQATFELLRAS